ncbi:MAG: hypothetical protein KJ731_12130, partial [Alphaproteobacteria bacterium]|nr:hypothetical protein [Alphaproteobacteria bacterium]
DRSEGAQEAETPKPLAQTAVVLGSVRLKGALWSAFYFSSFCVFIAHNSLILFEGNIEDAGSPEGEGAVAIDAINAALKKLD